jgi:hypothetical protein
VAVLATAVLPLRISTVTAATPNPDAFFTVPEICTFAAAMGVAASREETSSNTSAILRVVNASHDVGAPLRISYA